ncbi:LCP family protein [Amphibacillus xylanus]|uniref:Putative LytR family regulatory protein n=1 Tax=Amphibacillus xylanus (strain ATCC 51415 / DSM 6626 / JCM 7361 / LMG 17667 / NBRC 15112 / Ep01) TaxID=698758 RepID=K0J007_AMPXN|nr:LCP family protein [Amphibacillus xylanus]BAM48150.1 putative LytR family regulatory protein [Amphibacillus xylanus NBRC 15112]
MKKDNQAPSRLVKREVKKKQRNKKLIIFLVVPIVLLFLLIISYGVSVFFKAQQVVDNSFESDGRDGGSELREDEIDPNVDNVSILFIGVDQGGTRGNSGHGLSDALILATLNKEENSVKLLSIPRDSYVYVPERDRYTKINHAHSYGGAKATIETVENLLEVPIDYFVRINFDAFIDIVDTLNGVKVDVPYEIKEMDSNDTKGAIHLLPGEQWLNGEEALAFARTRKKDNDIERGKRQQQLISAMVDRAVSINTIFNIDALMTAVGDNMSTSMNFKDIVSFTNYGLKGNLQIESLNLEGSDLWTDAYYFQIDEQSLAETKQILQEHLGLTSPASAYSTEDSDDNL